MIRFVAVSYFGSRDVNGLVQSLLTQVVDDWRLMIVDNSVDFEETRRLERVAAMDSRIELLLSKENLGYIGAVRLAVSECDSAAAWTVVCNTDVALADSSALNNLLACDTAGIGILAPSVLSQRTGCDQNPFMRKRPSLAEQRRRRAQLANPLAAQASLLVSLAKQTMRRGARGGVAVAADVYAAHGSAFAFSSRYFDSGGGLDHPLFLFGEELFFAESCRRLGLTVRYEPAVKFVHREHANMGVLRSRKILDYMRASGQFGVDLLFPDC